MNTLIDWLIDGVALAVVATMAARLIPSGAPSHRHAFWWLTLASVLALPWAHGVFTESVGPVTIPALSGPTSIGNAPASLLTVPAPPGWLTQAVVAIWGCIALVTLLRLAVNLRAVRRLADGARPLPAHRVARLRRFAEAQVASRSARLCVSDEIRGACAVGFLHPRVLLSSDLVATLDDEAIEAIVLHEYAHLQRYDDWTRLVQRLVLALAGLHPGVWWVSRQIDVEREAACDRLAVARTGAPVVYARSLTAAAEISARMNGVTPIAAPGAFINGAGLHARVARLLAGAPARPRLARWVSVASAACLALAACVAAGMPPLVLIASREAPRLALTSEPLGAGVIRELPDVSGVGPVPLPADQDSSRQIVSDESELVPSASPAPVDMPSSDGAGSSAPVTVLFAVDAAPLPPHGQPLASAALPQIVMLPPPPSSVPPASAPARYDAGIGAGATRLGVATGDAATRAGNSIGRFFRNGGQAIAKQF